MNIEVKQNVALVREPGVLITGVQSALDLVATVNYETGCTAVVLPIGALAGDFWVLSTRLAGEVLQKFVNYHMRLAVVGDFTGLAAESRSLHDFLYESNQGSHILFAASEEEALERLGGRGR